MNLEFKQVLSQIIAFLAMLWILKRFAWKPLLDILEKRQEKIKGDFDAIKEQQKELNNQFALYQEKLNSIEEQSRVKIQEAIDEGREVARDIQEKARQHANTIIDKAQLEIKKEINQAKIKLKNDIVNLTIATTEKVVGDQLDRDKQEKLLSQAVDEVDFK